MSDGSARWTDGSVVEEQAESTWLKLLPSMAEQLSGDTKIIQPPQPWRHAVWINSATVSLQYCLLAPLSTRMFTHMYVDACIHRPPAYQKQPGASTYTETAQMASETKAGDIIETKLGPRTMQYINL